jgi:hypothetical protein
MDKYIFNNYGGSYQLSIKTPEDLKKVLDLDEALWAATSLPIDILNTDKKLFEYLDTDNNGRIRTDEIKDAVRWLFHVLKDFSHLSEATETLLLDSINTEISEGKVLKATAKVVLSNLGEKDKQNRITLSQVRNLQGIMAGSATNGDGVITPDATGDTELSKLINLIMKTVGSSNDASGKPGINAIQTNEFFTQGLLYLEWIEKGKIPVDKDKTDVMVWGKDTPDTFTCLKNVENKVEEFFAQCAITRFDDRVKNSLQLKQKELDEMDFTDRSIILDRLKTAPLAEINSEGVLHLDGYINSLYVDAFKDFKKNVLAKIYGGDIKQLTQKQWEEVKNIFSGYRIYIESKKGEMVSEIEESELKKYIQEDFKSRINALIQKDLAVAEKINHIRDIEKIILYQKFLMEIANNSTSFASVYDPEIRSIFEAGTLVIDGKKIPFTILVNDRNKHKKIAQHSNVYLMYLDITSKHNGDSKFGIAAAVTSGDSGTLRIGKRGIFFTRDGEEWDAEVTDIILNPIGLMESIKAPFIKLSDTIKNQVERFAKTRESKIETTLVAPSGTSAVRDILVGGGVAIAALGSSFAYIAKAVSQVKLVHFLITIGIILSAILFPGFIIGLIKLRRRNLSILFEASGCAINVRMKLTVGLGRLFTFIPPYPAGSRKNSMDIVAQLAKRIKKTKDLNWSRLLKIALSTVIICLIAAILILFFYRIHKMILY